MEHNAYARKFNMAVELKYGGRAGMAVPLFKELVDEGDAKSMVELANCYDEGLGVEQDYEIAKKLYEKAAEQDEPEALLNVGFNYFCGLYGKPNYKKAREYYEKAATQGHTNGIVMRLSAVVLKVRNAWRHAWLLAMG